MTFSLRSLVLVALSAYQAYAATSNCTTSTWTIGGSISLDTTNCTLTTVTAAIGADCLNSLYGGVGNVPTAVQKLCASMEE